MSLAAVRQGAFALVLLLSNAARADDIPLTVTVHPIARFSMGSHETRFGDLEFIGGFSYRGSDRRLSGVSAFRMRENGRFLAVTDTGYFFAGRIDHDAQGRPSALSQARLSPILGPDGKPHLRKGDADAEGLAIDGNDVLVSFERDHRIARFASVDDPGQSRPTPVLLPIPRKELRTNGGLETIAVSPQNSPLKGAAIVVAETSVDASGNHLAAILGLGVKGQFTVRHQAPWAITDGAFLPGGDLLLLERRYQGVFGIGMRIRRIDGSTIRPGALVDGPVLMEADFNNEIDNMEGLDVWRSSSGDTVLSVVSDDNGSFLQRNLYLEFRLTEPGRSAAGQATAGASR